MLQNSIFAPFFATIFLTFVVWVYMYMRRISYIKSQKIHPQDFAASAVSMKSWPPKVINPSDNLKNLFEIPVIFYALVLYLFITKQVDAIYNYAAWIFVIFRALHSAVHCTFNRIMLRFYLYLIATIAVWFMATRAAFAYWSA